MRTEAPPCARSGSVQTDDPVQAHLWSWLGYTVKNTASAPDFTSWKQELHATDIRQRVKAIYESPRVARNNRNGVITHLIELVRARRFMFESSEVLDIADEVNGLALLRADTALAELIEDDDPFVARSGCYGAGQSRSTVLIPSLLRLLHSPDSAVLKHAISALGIIVGETNEQRANCLRAINSFCGSQEWM